MAVPPPQLRRGASDASQSACAALGWHREPRGAGEALGGPLRRARACTAFAANGRHAADDSSGSGTGDNGRGSSGGDDRDGCGSSVGGDRDATTPSDALLRASVHSARPHLGIW